VPLVSASLGSGAATSMEPPRPPAAAAFPPPPPPPRQLFCSPTQPNLGAACGDTAVTPDRSSLGGFSHSARSSTKLTKQQVKPFTRESLERLESKTVQLVREYGFQPRRKVSVEDGSVLPYKFEPFPSYLYGRPLEEIDNFIYDEVSYCIPNDPPASNLPSLSRSPQREHCAQITTCVPLANYFFISSKAICIQILSSRS